MPEMHLLMVTSAPKHTKKDTVFNAQLAILLNLGPESFVILESKLQV